MHWIEFDIICIIFIINIKFNWIIDDIEFRIRYQPIPPVIFREHAL